MVKIKQVASKRPINRENPPIKRAIKSAKSIKTSAQIPVSLPKIPQKVQNILLARKSINQISPATKKIKKQVITPSSRFVLNSIPKNPFQKLVRAITCKFIPDCRYTKEALEAMQIASEDFLVGFFEDASLCMRHAKRQTLMVKDMALVAKLRNFHYEPL